RRCVARAVGGDQARGGAQNGVRLRGIHAPARRVVRALVRRRAGAVLDRVADPLRADAGRAAREADAEEAGGPPGVVVGVGWVAGLAAIRSLGRAGVRVLAVDDRQSALGFRSRYAEARLAPTRSGASFVDFLRSLGGGVVFPTHDDDLEEI